MIYKKTTLIFFLFSFLQFTYAQNERYIIGMFGAARAQKHYVDRCLVPVEQPVIDGHNTSLLNVLAADGFNLIQTYLPIEWTSEEILKSYLKLAAANGLRVEINAGHYYKPTLREDGGYPSSGENIYDNCGNSLEPCTYPFSQNFFRVNINDFIQNIYTQSPYKDIIWGYHICEEAAYFHHYHFTDDCKGNKWTNPAYFKYVEIPPTNVAQALQYFKKRTPKAQKMIVMEAYHHKSINDFSSDEEGIYAPQEYIKLLNKNDSRDVFFEGSYALFPEGWYFHDYDRMQTNDYHYLGFLKSIDYAQQYCNDVHKIVNIGGTSGGEDHWAKYHTDINVPNANWLWFQSYTSIIHGAKGIWFWDFNFSWNKNEARATEDIQNKNRFEKESFPVNYQKYTSFLAQELRYLTDKGWLDQNEKTILYTKTDQKDRYEVVPAATQYIPLYYNSEKRSENYGLRYTIRTNGKEAIMIVSNPLNTNIHTTLNFEFLAHPTIKNAKGVTYLFESNLPIGPYKTNRDSNIDLTKGTVGRKYYQPFIKNKKLPIDLGPMDVKVFKFEV